ncbi:MAG: fumarylacetoacetate hydrolase family protein [Alphaproteobacteria bacterium]|jgi:2-oxo-3-hexenedioate decarboxylase/2-keto-4-pentenoate hydratase|nr:fumarylacetoacetate hydrolase family protein [Alphaproteobacteria bacterium]MDP6873532.1 fumarylacetoacetate hydrolase family protein [Alphaproteobacteria bacterium]
MDAVQCNRAADLLMQARLDHRRMAALPDDCRPIDEAEAYQVQDRYVDRMLAQHGDGIIGYKAGCTNVTAQQQLGLSSPFAGALLEAFALASPAGIPSEAGFMRMIEAEIGFRLGRDLPTAGAPYDAASVRPALAAAFGAIEVVDSRYDDWTTAGAAHLIADNACTGFWVHGQETTDIDSLDLANHPVLVRRNGVEAEKGSSANVLDNPLNVVAWLANHLCARGTSLKSGQLITTGTMIAVNDAEKGDVVEADFGTLGLVKVTFI